MANHPTSKKIEPLYSGASNNVIEAAKQVQTPAIIYDFSEMKDVAAKMQEDICLVKGARLNLALKATHTPELLSMYAGWGLGCDVASIGELQLALEAGFKEISTTNPAFSKPDMELFAKHNIVMDLDSISQIQVYGEAFPGTNIGLRVRVPLPQSLESDSTFGADSRFGVNILDPGLREVLEKYNLTVTRIHVHTGQMTPESLLYKAKYLLAVSEYFPCVEVIDFGGGMFHFYINREEAIDSLLTLNELISQWEIQHRRSMKCRFEPGGALLAGCGYLVSSVRANEFHSFYNTRIITVDASAWNLAPWHKPEVMNLNRESVSDELVLIAGNTLYEGDFFGKSIGGQLSYFNLPSHSLVGDRILFNASGAYTITNGRTFNRLPLPKEYLLVENKLTLLNSKGELYG